MLFSERLQVDEIDRNRMLGKTKGVCENGWGSAAARCVRNSAPGIGWAGWVGWGKVQSFGRVARQPFPIHLRKHLLFCQAYDFDIISIDFVHPQWQRNKWQRNPNPCAAMRLHTPGPSESQQLFTFCNQTVAKHSRIATPKWCVRAGATAFDNSSVAPRSPCAAISLAIQWSHRPLELLHHGPRWIPLLFDIGCRLVHAPVSNNLVDFWNDGKWPTFFQLRNVKNMSWVMNVT